ncbi:hypothetical protein ACCC88_02035 [Sphingomonas sp. Sphisp140]|uniref:hypothetical protein n=1 Tax=unclassified Sphingomonas TaxID=196159 RepID=UPI0039AFC32D
MRSLPSLLICAFVLASCASQPVQISANKCWSVSAGEKVEGTAVLFANAQNDACIECGASVSGRDCPGVGFAAGNNSVDQAYDHIVQSARADGFGFVQPVVYLSGEVIPNGATGKPMIRANQLRLIEAGQQNGS